MEKCVILHGNNRKVAANDTKEMKKDDLNFTIYCVGIVAESLGRDERDVYRLMLEGNIIMGYIVPCFDVLHSFSREYIIEDLTQLMRKKGLLAA